MPAAVRSDAHNAFLTFGELLRYLRRRAGLTQTELAIAVGYSHGQISRLEHNQRIPDPTTVAALFFTALGLQDEPAVQARLLALAAPARAQHAGAATSLLPWHNLPLPLTSFIGREADLAQLDQLLSLGRLVTLTGSGGVGKTRLALQVVERAFGQFQGGACWVDLAPLADPTLVTPQIAAALGVRGDHLYDKLIGDLRVRQLLLAVDNCEQVVEACADLLNRLLLACPRLRVVATSREPLGIAGELVHRVPSLTFPDPGDLPSLEHLTDYAAIRMFVERARLVLPDFDLTLANAPATVQICRRLDGIPLAIELAAARLAVLPVEQIATRLDDCFQLLTSGSRTALPKHQTLQASMDWSYELLAAAEQALLRRLAVFAGSWALEAAEAIGAGPNGMARDVFSLLARLADKSLVRVDSSNASAAGRFRLLETVRQYGLSKLAGYGELSAARREHAEYFLALAERAEPELMGPMQPEWLDRLDADHENLRAALEWSQASGGDEALGARLAGALWRFWFLRGYLVEADTWLERTTRPTGLAASLLAKVLAGAAFLANFRGDTARALHVCERSLGLSREAGDQRLMAFLLSLQGESFCQNGDFVPGAAALDESLALARGSGDRWLIAFSLTQSVELASMRHDHDRATVLAEEALTVARQVADRWLVAFALFRSGRVATDRGDYQAAWALHDEGLAIRREIGDPLGVAYALLGLANVAGAQGDYAAAWTLTEERLGIERQLHHTLGVAHVLNNMGCLAYAHDGLDRAIACFEESLGLCRELANHWCVAAQLYHLGWIEVDRGNYAQAANHFKEGLALCDERELRGYLRPILVGGLGRLAERLGDYAMARARYVERLAGYHQIGDEEGVLYSLICLGTLTMRQSQSEEAVRLWGAAEGHPLFNGVVDRMRRQERQEYREAVAVARATLGEANFEVATAEGRAMPLEQVVTFALSASDI